LSDESPAAINEGLIIVPVSTDGKRKTLGRGACFGRAAMFFNFMGLTNSDTSWTDVHPGRDVRPVRAEYGSMRHWSTHGTRGRVVSKISSNHGRGNVSIS
jgi:hypothetical protein